MSEDRGVAGQSDERCRRRGGRRAGEVGGGGVAGSSAASAGTGGEGTQPPSRRRAKPLQPTAASRRALLFMTSSSGQKVKDVALEVDDPVVGAEPGFELFDLAGELRAAPGGKMLTGVEIAVENVDLVVALDHPDHVVG